MFSAGDAAGTGFGAGVLRLGMAGGRKSSVDLGATLGCDFFFSCEINSTNFKSPSSTNIRG